MYYSPTTGGFYAIELQADYSKNGAWPDDAIEISPGDERNIRQAKERGQTVTYKKGAWKFADQPIDEKMVAASWRARRDAALSSCDYLAMPDYPLTDADRTALYEYRKALRDVTEQAGFPNRAQWPVAPGFVK